MRILFFDVDLFAAIFVKTPQPRHEFMLLAGYHKSKGDDIVLTWKVPEFHQYDKVYISAFDPDTFVDPEWLRHSNVVPILPSNKPDKLLAEAEHYPPYQIYQSWLDDRLERYPSQNKKRFIRFCAKPWKLKRGDEIHLPTEPDCVIIDEGLEEWDYDCSILSQIKHKYWLLYPQQLGDVDRWKYVLKEFNRRKMHRSTYWATWEFNRFTEWEDILEAFKADRPSSMFRIKMILSERTHDKWLELLPRAYDAVQDFRMESGKRLFVKTLNRQTFDYPTFLGQFDRYTAKDNGFKFNSMMSYILIDNVGNFDQQAIFLRNPYKHTNRKKLLKEEMVAFIERYPDVAEKLWQSYPRYYF